MTTAAPAPPREAFPAWAKLLVVIAVLVALWVVGQAIGGVLLVFLVSVILALLLNPLVRFLRRRARLPRGLAVLSVFLVVIGTLVLGVFLVIDPVRGQVEEINRNLPVYTDQATRQVEDLQGFLDDRGIAFDVEERVSELIEGLQERVDEIIDDILTYSLDVLAALITIVIVLVASIYMLLDAPRIARFAERLGGPKASAFLRRTERTLAEYVKAQVLVALVMGVSVGIVLWFYGVSGLFPLGATFAVAFAAWAFLMEFIPYVGAFLGAIPPVLLALFTSPLAALWVALAFLVLQQVQSNAVTPKLMSSAVGVHPLVVIFGLLVGQALAGIWGVLLALPMIVIVKEAVLYVAELLGATGAWTDRPQPGPPPDTEPLPAPGVRVASGEDTGVLHPTLEAPTRSVEVPGLRADS